MTTLFYHYKPAFRKQVGIAPQMNIGTVQIQSSLKVSYIQQNSNPNNEDVVLFSPFKRRFLALLSPTL